MRKLKTSDLFSLIRILKKMDLKEEIKAIGLELEEYSDKEAAQRAVYTNLVILITEHLANAEEEIYKFLGELSNKKAKDIAEQQPIETINMLKELFSEDNFGDFLSLALK